MRKLLIAVMFWAGLVQAVSALTVEQRLVDGLQAQGFTILEKGYTFLGRLRIVAESDLIHREIVVNPGTGEILRDYAIYLSDMAPQTVAPQRDTRSSGSAHNTTDRGTSTGTAGVAASVLPTGTDTLGAADIQVETRQSDPAIPLDATILPMSSGTP